MPRLAQPLLSVLVIAAALTAGCASGPSMHELRGETMGTTYSIKVVLAAPPSKASVRARIAELADEIEQELVRVNGMMSLYIEDSDLRRLNAAPSGVPVSVPAPLFEVLQLARQVSEETGGAFDVTLAPVIKAWGFGPGAPGQLPPSQEDLEALRASVGFRHLTLDPETGTVVKLADGVSVDLGGIAKGYGVDRIAELLDRLDFEHYMVEIGGEVRTAGLNADGVAWRIGVEQPDPFARSIRRVLSLSGEAMATSGDYRNYFELDGLRYSHTIDPRTLRPVLHEITSVTVLHERCVLADAYATAFLALGPEEGPAAAERLGVATLFIMTDHEGGHSERAVGGFPQAVDK